MPTPPADPPPHRGSRLRRRPRRVHAKRRGGRAAVTAALVGALIATLVGVPLAASPAVAGPNGKFQARVTDLGPTTSDADVINDLGHVVGHPPTGNGLYFYDGSFTSIPGNATGGAMQALDINNHDEIVGSTELQPQVGVAFHWSPSAGFTTLPTLGGPSALATDVNENGMIVGTSLTASSERHAFAWTAAGGITDLGTLPSMTSSEALAVNDAGQVVGYSGNGADVHAFVWDAQSGMTDLGTLGGNDAAATAINEQGVVAGESTTAANGLHAFVWTSATGLTDLGLVAGLPYSTAVAVNAHGQVLGLGFADNTPSFIGPRPFLYDVATGTTTVLPAVAPDGTMAYALNDAGTVAGQGVIPGQPFPTFSTYLWTSLTGAVNVPTLGGQENFVMDPGQTTPLARAPIAPHVMNAAGQLAVQSNTGSGSHGMVANIVYAPDAPALTGAAGEGAASLEWTAPADNGDAIDHFRVYRDGVEVARVRAGQPLVLQDTGLVSGTSYTYEVTAVNSVGESVRSNPVVLVPTAAPVAAIVATPVATPVAARPALTG